MEREKNGKRLTKEIEEEKMKHELKDVGMYEAGMTYNEMKSFLVAINESKHPTSASNNKSIQKESQHCNKECLLENEPDTNEPEQVGSQEANTEIPRPSYSYRQNRTSPTLHECKTRYSNSPESPPSFAEIAQRNKRKSSDSDEMFEAQLSENDNSRHNTNRYNLFSRSGSVLRECQNATEKRAVQDTQRELLERKLERWRLNPLNVTVNEKDVPLRQPNRPQAQERVPFRYCKEAHTSEERDQVMRALSQHLKNMAELWYTWQPATYSIFQWGSPIQVGTANGSLDRKPLTNFKAEQIKAECTYRNNHERVCKRKASFLIAQYRKERNLSTEDEDDDYTDLARIKKKKIQSGNKINNTERAANQHTHASHEKATTSTISHQRSSNDDNNDPNPKNTRRKRKTAEEKERSPELYPRRIVPPVPKARLSLSRHRKENTSSKLSQQIQNTDKIVEQTKSQQKSEALSTEQITEKLHDWSNSEDKSAAAKNVEIRPLPIPTNVQSKLQQKRLMSKKTETTTEAIAETSVLLVRLPEKNDQGRGKEMGLKLFEKQKKKENSNRIENRNGKWEDDLSNDKTKLSEKIQASEVRNGNHSDNVSTSSNNVNCPICNKLFHHDEIENHAANCEQYDMDDESNYSNQLECEICNNYKTHKMEEYERHVVQCTDKKKDEMRSHETEDIDTVPTSSFSTFKPISELEDSEIDYLGQFSSKTPLSSKNKRKISNKKRKL